MDGEGKFWLGLWTVVAFALVALAAIIAAYSTTADSKYHATVQNCTNRGGTWIPARLDYGICLQIDGRRL